MAIRFSAEMKIESKNYNYAIFIYSKIEKKTFNTICAPKPPFKISKFENQKSTIFSNFPKSI